MGELELLTLGSVDIQPAMLDDPSVSLADLPVPDSVKYTVEPELRVELPVERFRRVGDFSQDCVKALG
jgi:hypothetical protein